LLTRLPETDAAIRNTLGLDWSDFLERMKISDQKDPRFIKEEVLVFLLRAGIAGGAQAAADEISRMIFKRVEKQIEKYARTSFFEGKIDKLYIEEAVGDMLGDLFIKISDIDSDKGDFAQIRFGMFLKTLCFDRLKTYKRRSRKDDQSLFLDEIDPETNQPTELEDESFSLSEEEKQSLKNGLMILPEPHRTAFVLRHYEGLQIESNDPDEWTISSHFSKTSRTVRNWLKHCEELLGEWRRENLSGGER
jgi:hypothetical protein